MVLLSDIMNPTNECRASIANYVRKKVSQLAVLNIPATGVLIARLRDCEIARLRDCEIANQCGCGP
ncbi:hypothetical protein SAMN03084138_03837 [Enterovibrio norvegicus DSM 15893]|uniref:Uncharacterized protein n=1 Tax=Enterovibrio norvegicus DSM 15893 TaxID=1121869 RepID=A0A1I5V5W3_9GAMM|nr:hypothetical protein SAMN03084138_03837 [Enterovibrio norvegicus DSM 15893]